MKNFKKITSIILALCITLSPFVHANNTQTETVAQIEARVLEKYKTQCYIQNLKNQIYSKNSLIALCGLGSIVAGAKMGLCDAKGNPTFFGNAFALAGALISLKSALEDCSDPENEKENVSYIYVPNLLGAIGLLATMLIYMRGDKFVEKSCATPQSALPIQHTIAWEMPFAHQCQCAGFSNLAPLYL